MKFFTTTAVLPFLLAMATASPAPLPETSQSSASVTRAILQARAFDSCTIPAGYVYTSVRSTLNQCSPGNFANVYTVQLPADLLSSCQVPGDGQWTYSSSRRVLNTCSPGNFATQYVLRVPKNGLEACTVPPGWGYSSVTSRLNVCADGAFANSYVLRK